MPNQDDERREHQEEFTSPLDRLGAGMTADAPFVVEYARYFCYYKKEHSSLDSALRWVARQEDAGAIAALQIRHHGHALYESRAALADAAWALLDRERDEAAQSEASDA